ncbi:MAG: hypothetical protein LWW91_06615, partial [Bacteroidales bacterium]|nr:hypothetical protein [Bacteroidales bacterium]
MHFLVFSIIDIAKHQNKLYETNSILSDNHTFNELLSKRHCPINCVNEKLQEFVCFPTNYFNKVATTITIGYRHAIIQAVRMPILEGQL